MSEVLSRFLHIWNDLCFHEDERCRMLPGAILTLFALAVILITWIGLIACGIISG